MAQALRDKFNGRGEEILKYALTFGMWETMREYDVRDLLAMERYLIEVSGDPQISKKCIASSAGTKNIFKSIVDEYLCKLLEAYAERDKAIGEARIIRAQLEMYKRHDEIEALQILETIRV